MVELVVRLVFSLAVVIGMLLLLARFSAKRFRGGSDAMVRVVHRQPLSRTSAVAVVTVGSRVLVLGTTEQNVQLLTELEPDEVEEASSAPALELVSSPSSYVPRHAADQGVPSPVRTAPVAAVADGALAGSVLSAQTWKQAFAVATGRARDAS